MAGSEPGMSRRMRRLMVVTSSVVLASVLLSATAASATWSIVAVDPETGRVGAVLASCVDAGILGESNKPLIPIVLAPGFGVAAIQGTFKWEAPAEIQRLLGQGEPAADVIDFLISDTFETDPDLDSRLRQYGVVSLEQGPDNDERSVEVADLSAVFTGESIEREYHAVAGRNVAVQGLLLPDRAVVNDAAAAYAAAVDSSKSMEQALVDALVAGSDAGGDRRCGDQTALFAHLVVAEPDEDPFDPSTLLTVTVDEGDGQNPVLLLSDAFDQGQSGWIDAGRRSSFGVSKLWAAVAATLVGVAGFLILRQGMGDTAARR